MFNVWRADRCRRQWSFSSVFSKRKHNRIGRLPCYALAVLVNLMLVAGFFTASVANTGPCESIARLHMRYYNFALPLLLMIAASQLSSQSITGMRRWRALMAFPIGLAIIYAVCTRLAPYTPGFVDSPELTASLISLQCFMS